MNGGRTKVSVSHQIHLSDGPPTQPVAGAALLMCILDSCESCDSFLMGKVRNSGLPALRQNASGWKIEGQHCCCIQGRSVLPLEKGLHNHAVMWGDPKGTLVATFIPLPCSHCSCEYLLRCRSKDLSQLEESSTWTEHSRGEK